MLKRLKIKFILIFMITVTLMLGIILGTVIHLTHENIEQQSISAMRSIVVPPNIHGKPEKEFEPFSRPYFMLIVSPEGKIIADGNGFWKLSDNEYISQLYSYAEESEKESDLIPNTSLRFLRNKTPMGNSYVFTDISAELEMLKGLYKTSIIIGIAAFILFLFISIFLAKWAVRPVEDAWNKQKQFIADASHELKTPLTVIMTNAELMQSEQSEENKNRFSGNILEMSRQMRGLVESLLELARIDNGSITKNFSSIDLSEITSSAVLPFEALFFEKEQIFSSQIDSDICINGCEEQIRQVIDILLDNAHKYSPARSKINLSLKKYGKNQCRLSVSNDGEQIPAEDLKNIFKRFYRGDKTRQMNHSYGLGLSIAESIVKEHSGKIWAESENRINTFTVQLHLI